MKTNKKILPIMLIAAVLIFGTYVTYTQLSTNPISHEFVSWTQAGSEVTTAKVNNLVTLNLNIFNKGWFAYQGDIKVQIKKDVPLLTDVVYITKTITVNIPAGGKQAVSVAFTPNEKTGLGSALHEYFYKIYIAEKAIYDPTMSGDRNGLLVGDSPSSSGDPTTGMPTVTGVLFNGMPQITVAPGTTINTKVALTGTGTGTLRVEIRKDIIFLLDSSYTTIQKDVTITGMCTVDMPIWIAKEGGIGFRSYFSRIYWNDNLVYDMTDPTQRPYVALSASGSNGDNGSGGSGNGSVILKSVQWTLTPNGNSKASVVFTLTGTVNKAVTVDIRQDISLLLDNNLQSVPLTLTGSNTDVAFDVPFTAPSTGSWIFLRVMGVYDNTDPTARKAQGTEIQIPVTGTDIAITQPGYTPQPSGSGTVSLKSVQWTLTPNGNSKASVVFTLTGTVNKTVTVDIRQDIMMLPDVNLQSSIVQLSGTNKDVGYDATFIAPTSGSSVFIRVLSVYDATNRDQRIAQGTQIVIPTSSTSQPPTPTSTGYTPLPTQPHTNVIVSFNVVELISASGIGTKINVPVGTAISTYVTVSSTAATSGTLSVEVRKDMVLASDATYTTLSKNVELVAGTNTITLGSWTANDPTNSIFRQYFFKVSWNGVVIYDPTDPNTRERVTTTAGTPVPTPQPTSTYVLPPATPPLQQGTLTVDNVGFGWNPEKPVLTVDKWQTVPVYVHVTVTGGAVYKQVRVQIKKDIIGGADTVFKELCYPVNLANGQSLWAAVGSFVPDERTTTNPFAGLRQYFAKAGVGDCISNTYSYDPTDPNTRNHVLVN